MERVALSVSTNIAEGFERGTTNELLAFLYIARGSAGEVRSMLCFLERRSGFVHFRSQISDLKSIADDRLIFRYDKSVEMAEIKEERKTLKMEKRLSGKGIKYESS